MVANELLTGPLRIADLYCGGGGVSVGYVRAIAAITGSMPEIVGVDISEQPDYPYEFVHGDALEFDLTGFDFAHASPPCQLHVQWNGINRARNGSIPDHPDLIPPTRELLEAWGGPYVIENVVGAPLRNPLMLCGSMFGLGVRRHRLFESNVMLMGQKGCRHTRQEIAVYGKLDGRRIWTRADGSEVRAAKTLEQAQAAMGIDWISDWDTLKEAIPPAYTAYIGEQIVPQLRRVAA